MNAPGCVSAGLFLRKNDLREYEMEQEKKVEYIELIYDLIFVYIIGRNNSLLHVMRDGFIDPGSFLTYGLTALIILQIWYYTTLFINRYGENDRMMHAGIYA